MDGCISSELPVFFELRIRYLLSCERVGEAMALAKCCAWHPTAGQHLFFLQVYLTWLLKTSQHDCLHKEVGGLINFHGIESIFPLSPLPFLRLKHNSFPYGCFHCPSNQVAKLNGKDAVHIICSLECEEKDELLLALSRAFLSQQLCRGDMYYLWLVSLHFMVTEVSSVKHVSRLLFFFFPAQFRCALTLIVNCASLAAILSFCGVNFTIV